MQWSGLKRRLPDNVHLLTLEQWEASSILLRLEHFYAKDEDPVLSQPAKVQLKVCVCVVFAVNEYRKLTHHSSRVAACCPQSGTLCALHGIAAVSHPSVRPSVHP